MDTKPIKKFFTNIILFLRNIFLIIIGLIKKIFSSNKKESKKNNILKEENTSKNKINNNDNKHETFPDTNNIKSNPHDESDNEEDNIILTLPKKKADLLKNINQEINYMVYTKEEIEELIDKELEKTYEKYNLKIKDANKEIKSKIKEIKEIIVPHINYQITKEKPKKEELITIIRKEVKEIVKEKPLFKEIETEKEKEPYFVAHLKKAEILPPPLEIPKIKINNSIKTTTSQITKKHLSEPSTIMVQNVPEIKKTPMSNEIKNTAIAASVAVAASALEIIKPTKKDVKETVKEEIKEKTKEEQLTTIITSNNGEKIIPIELPALKKVEEEVQEIKEKIEQKEIIEQEKPLETLEKIHNDIEAKLETIEMTIPEEKEPEKKEEIKNLIKDTEIEAISKTTDAVINDSNSEIKKEEFEDKDYDRLERQINHMLNDITNTFLKYGNRLTPNQKKKLEQEEHKLRHTKEIINASKAKDIQHEKNILEEEIHEEEILGLQEELKKMNLEYKETVSDNLLKKMDKLENMTHEQIANADKRILMKRLNKASLLLEIGSILAFPFIRNKYFFYFTIGLVIDNHFNFINSFWRRKVNQYEPADLSAIKKGQDALNGALDITYKNIVELDYIEQQAINRYPELTYDYEFINRVTNLRIRLNNQYNKLMRKNKIMEKYYLKTKHQRKILKDDMKKAS